MKRKESDMNPINPVCRPATENEINYGEAKWCAKCTRKCDSKGKDELVMCDYFKTNDNDPIVPGCPSLMPHTLPGGFYGVANAEEGTQMPEPKEFAAREATREKSSQVGNSAKMRDALSEISNLADALDIDNPNVVAILDQCRDALAAPPRNCDVGTDEEQLRRYEELCYSHTCGSRCSLSGCPLYEYDCSPFAWGQMPYEKGSAK